MWNAVWNALRRQPSGVSIARWLRDELVPAQAMFKNCAYRDVDCSGIGVYAFIGELAGDAVAGTSIESGRVRMMPETCRGIDPIVHGFQVRVYLPATETAAMYHGDAIAAVGATLSYMNDPNPEKYPIPAHLSLADADPDWLEAVCRLQQQYYVAYAWPQSEGAEMFAVDQRGIVHRAAWNHRIPLWGDLTSNRWGGDTASDGAWTPCTSPQF